MVKNSFFIELKQEILLSPVLSFFGLDPCRCPLPISDDPPRQRHWCPTSLRQLQPSSSRRRQPWVVLLHRVGWKNKEKEGRGQSITPFFLSFKPNHRRLATAMPPMPHPRRPSTNEKWASTVDWSQALSFSFSLVGQDHNLALRCSDPCRIALLCPILATQIQIRPMVLLVGLEQKGREKEKWRSLLVILLYPLSPESNAGHPWLATTVDGPFGEADQTRPDPSQVPYWLESKEGRKRKRSKKKKLTHWYIDSLTADHRPADRLPTELRRAMAKFDRCKILFWGWELQ